MGLEGLTDFGKNVFEGYFYVTKPISKNSLPSELGRYVGATSFIFTLANFSAGVLLKLMTDDQYYPDEFYPIAAVPILTQVGRALYDLHNYQRSKVFKKIDWNAEADESDEKDEDWI